MEKFRPHEGGLRHHLLRTLFWVLVVLGFVFAVAGGVETARYMQERKMAIRYAKAGFAVLPQGDSYRILPRLIYNRQQEVRLFGNISKVEGNKITVINNAAAEQVVISTADTQIYASTTEVGISALKAGQDAVFTGVVQDGQVQASLIELK